MPKYCPWCATMEIQNKNQFVTTWSCGSSETESGEPEQSDECMHLILRDECDVARKVARQLYFKVLDMNPRDHDSKRLNNLHHWLSDIDEGEHCIWPGCGGVMGYEEIIGLPCPPCSTAVEYRLICDKCGWKEPKND